MRPTTLLNLLAFISIAVALTACGDPKKSAKGFRLPDGDIDKGKQAFITLECYLCHPVAGVDMPDFAEDSPISLQLGGEVRQVKNYGQLVTSIVNPDHVVSKRFIAQLPSDEREGVDEDSPMPVFNDLMTVEQMIDIVAFLQSRYQLLKPDYDDFGYSG